MAATKYDFRPNLKEAYRIFCLTEIPFLISLERWLDNIRVQKTFHVKALIKKIGKNKVAKKFLAELG